MKWNEQQLQQRRRITATIATLREHLSAQEISNFQGESVDELAKLFDALMEKFRMPATVVADELFTCLLCVIHTRNVDPASLENEPLAKALRAHDRDIGP